MTGQCQCKPSTATRTCAECADMYYGFPANAQSVSNGPTPFKIHTPLVEDFGQVFHRGSVNLQIHLPSWVIFQQGLSQGE